MSYMIRPVRTSDATEINAIRRQPSVMQYTLGIPSERKEKSEQFLASVSDWNHMFVAADAENDNKILGVASLQVNASPRLRHSAAIGISIHEDHQNKGIGTALMETLLDLADNFLMIKRVELSVVVDNPRAQHLYEKLGFEIEGIKKAAIMRGGTYVDEIMMARIK